MRIGIVSDTHLSGGRRLPVPLLDGLQGVDAIIHAGDWVTLDVYEELSAIAPVYGVAGNGDGEELVRRFGKKTTVEFDGVRFGVVHGHEGPGRSTPERARLAFREQACDVVVFGHSHIPFSEKDGGLLLFNPGSPTDKRRQPRYSFGIVTTGSGTFEAEHVFFDKEV
ncbi:metallophosphoesterase [Paenibacillus hodogayensis]|uniref:Phosphoesterase n=1 Tax=Paenibacillus hodogayensis TaxID=279208 RepID=A0ABV5W2A0_9BACL